MVRRLILAAAIGLGMFLSLGAVGGYVTKVYLTDGGDTQTIASGGKVAVESGGTIEFASGGLMTGTVAIGGTGTFATGTGAVALNGDVTVASAKNLGMSGASTLTTGTGTVSLNGDVTVAAGKDISLAAGAGYIEANGTTSGGIRIDPIDVGTGLTTIVNSAGTPTVTLPATTTTLLGKDITGQKGYLQLDGATDGGIKIAPIATGTAVATIQNQNVAASVITLPNATATLATLGLTEALDAKTLTNAGAITQTGAVAFGTGTDTVSLNGDVAVAAGKDISLAAGAGYIELLGANDGSIKIAAIATGTGEATIQNQNVATSVITLPAATCTLPGLGLANVWSSTNEFAGVTQTGAATFATGTGAVSLNGDVAVAADKDLVLAQGTGYLELNAETSGSLKIIPVAATAQAVTLTTAAQTGGAGTLTIPNLAGATETIATVAGPDTFADTKLTSKLVKAVAQKAQGALYMTGISVDEELFTLNGRKYGVDVAKNGVAAADVAVEVDNTTADELVTKFAAAINADGTSSLVVSAVADTTNDILFIYAKTAGVAGNALTLVEAFTNGDVSDATLVDGTDAAVKGHLCYRHVITATEATGGAAAAVRFDTGLSAICSIQVTFEDAGVNAASDVVIGVAGGIVTLTEGSAPAWAVGDIINLVVIGLE